MISITDKKRTAFSWPVNDLLPMSVQLRSLHKMMTLMRVCKAVLVMGAMSVLALGSALAQSADRTLVVVTASDLKIVDPIWTTALITRDHGYMVYDTLFAQD